MAAIGTLLCLFMLSLSNVQCGLWKTENRNVRADGSEPVQKWGYVDVRPAAHMFYWLYETTAPAGPLKTPLIMWLQGGPGGSGTGFGNFEELGPLDVNLKPRNTTWLSVASLLFVDNPVGTGYSYVDDDSAYTTDVAGIAADMLVLLKNFFTKGSPQMQTVPFYIFSESYGGKMTAAISTVLYKAIQDGEIKCQFKGLAMGDSWISPIDSTLTWGPYLYVNSLVDRTQLQSINASAEKVQDLITAGRWRDATQEWGHTQNIIEVSTNGVNFYNILKWGAPEHSLRETTPRASVLDEIHSRLLGPLHQDDLSALMNGPIRKKLRVIPDKVKWGGQSSMVFTKQSVEFMKPVVNLVDSLIEKTNLSVVVYSGQLDLIVDTLGTEDWVYQLTCTPEFMKAKKTAIFDPITKLTSAFVKKAKNLSFYWILNAGHMSPQDSGDTVRKMVEMVLAD